MRKEARILLDKAIASLMLAVEQFNKPSDLGRVSAVLIFMDHAFEMLLKSAIVHRGGRIRGKNAKQTVGFDHCVRIGVSDGKRQFLTNEDALLLQAINGLRDAAQHHTLDISEALLYMQCQAGLTLFAKLIRAVFGEDLAKRLPARVLPLCTVAPTDLTTLFETEIAEIQKLLQPGRRHRFEAESKLRALAILEAALQGEHLQPSRSELGKIGEKVSAGTDWHSIFPGVAAINITSTGIGPAIDLRITKSGTPVMLVQEGTPGAAVVALKRVNELDFYNLGARQLATKLCQKVPAILAVVEHLGLQNDQESFKTIQIGSQTYKRYSQKAIAKLQACIASESLPEMEAAYWLKRKKKKETK